jgi:hypothetical protein
MNKEEDFECQMSQVYYKISSYYYFIIYYYYYYFETDLSSNKWRFVMKPMFFCFCLFVFFFGSVWLRRQRGQKEKASDLIETSAKTYLII